MNGLQTMGLITVKHRILLAAPVLDVAQSAYLLTSLAF